MVIAPNDTLRMMDIEFREGRRNAYRAVDVPTSAFTIYYLLNTREELLFANRVEETVKICWLSKRIMTRGGA